MTILFLNKILSDGFDRKNIHVLIFAATLCITKGKGHLHFVRNFGRNIKLWFIYDREILDLLYYHLLPFVYL